MIAAVAVVTDTAILVAVIESIKVCIAMSMYSLATILIGHMMDLVCEFDSLQKF